MNKLYIVTSVIDVVAFEGWRLIIEGVVSSEKNSRGHIIRVTSRNYHTARNKEELKGLIEHSFKDRLVDINIEYVRESHPQDSALCELYPFIGRYKVKAKPADTFCIYDRKEGKELYTLEYIYKGEKSTKGAFKDRHNAVTKMLEIEKNNKIV